MKTTTIETTVKNIGGISPYEEQQEKKMNVNINSKVDQKEMVPFLGR